MNEIGTPLKNSQQAQLKDAVQTQSQEAGLELSKSNCILKVIREGITNFWLPTLPQWLSELPSPVGLCAPTIPKAASQGQ